MDRIELIRGLAAKPTKAVTYRPKGMHCATTGAEPATDSRPKDRKRGLGVLLRGSWGPLTKMGKHRYDWLKQADKESNRGFKAGFRHEAHALTRIAERLRRR